ncbi:VWA domain-containing protein [Alkalilimnicola ehrlichii]|uniref:VWA domain-containing protein n=1 Tax=Alkalilimnicola ehrlichii TaxID=351052 RepID=UPI003BA248D2
MNAEIQALADELRGTHREVAEVLDACLAEATRVMSTDTQARYLEAALALNRLGRGHEIVITWLEAMPPVAREAGEAIVPDTASAALKLASMVSGEVVGLLFDSLPTAARRLGDDDLLRQYLALIHQLSGRAPRALRPLFTHLDQLLAVLTLSGLRRWALWGVQAYARDYDRLSAYFALESADSQQVLQQERRGVLFVDVQRRLGFYLRALWGRDFFLRPNAAEPGSPEARPFIEAGTLHLPDAMDNVGSVSGLEVYRAQCAHAAAHIGFGEGAPMQAEALSPGQRYLMGLIEDARVEALSVATFPGLFPLWRRLLNEAPRAEDPTLALLQRLAIALLDPQWQDDHPVVAQLAGRFHQRIQAGDHGWELSAELGLDLIGHLQDAGPLPPLSRLETLPLAYRDDNRYLWAEPEEAELARQAPAKEAQVRRRPSVIEMVNELDCELAGDDAQEIWILDTEFYRDGDPEGVSINELEGKPATSPPFHYQEWDYKAQLHRPDWVTLMERRQPAGDPDDLKAIMDEYRPVARRLQRVIDSLIPQGLVRERRQEDGDEIDLDAAIRARIDQKTGHTPDHRVSIRYHRQERDLAVLLLLDLSESANDTLPGSDRPLIQLTREATTLLAWAADSIGDPFAVHGFASETRHDVHYHRFKDFDQPWDDAAQARVAGLEAGLSTRMGAALRHAGHYMTRRPERHRLILLLSDGAPSDIDAPDPQYLRQDTRKAVEALQARGVHAHCLTLDPGADQYVQQLFGPRGYTVLDHPQRLPEKLPTLFASLTR